MKNILFILHRYPGAGGIESVTTTLANYFSSVFGWEITIFSFISQKEDILSQKLNKNIVYKMAKEPSIFGSTKNKELLKHLIEERSISTIIFQDSYAPIESVFYKEILENVELIVVEHNKPTCFLSSYKSSWKQLKWWTIGGFIRKIIYPYSYLRIKKDIYSRHVRLYQMCNKYILLSDLFKPSILKMTGDLSKVFAIHNPIASAKKRISVAEKKNTVLFVGRLSLEKGLDRLIKIWSLIEPKLPDWELKIVGDGELKTFLENEIAKKGLTRISLEGFKNPEEYYTSAKIFMMTSTFEGFGLVLVEAMSLGAVPLAFDSFESVKDIINDNENGFLIKPFDIEAYATKVIALAKNKDLLLRMSQQAYIKSFEFETSKIANEWNILLEN